MSAMSAMTIRRAFVALQRRADEITEGKRSGWIGRASNPVGGAMRSRVGSTPIPLRHVAALPGLGRAGIHRENGNQAMSNAMSYKGYTASMVFDTEDKIIVGRVLDIDDIMAFHGVSVTEFEANFHAVVDDYLAASAALGSAPEKPASGKVMLRIAPEVHAAALKAAARSGTSLNRWAEGALGKAARKPASRAVARKGA